jgi:tRNA G10  N-methylase Trm11
MSGSRRALTHVGGAVVRDGAKDESLALGHALDVAPSTGDESDPARAHVHGFHAYPARMHPVTATRLVELTSVAGTKVLDPFCGSGTVLVCAMLARRDAIGVDLNPLAVLLASRKVAARDEAHVERLLAAAARAREHADARRAKKAGALRRYGRDDVAAFDPHVLLELDGLRDAIEREPDGVVRDDLRVVLAAILVKVSRRPADTAGRGKDEEAPKRIAAGYAAKLFQKKTEELVRRLRDLDARMPSPRPRALVFCDDARVLGKVRDGEAAAVVTSPPYAGTYDYVAHHALRLRWLGLHSARFEQGEIGSRRELGRGGPAADASWEQQLGAVFSALHRVLRPGGRAAFVVGDSELGGRAVRADRVFATVAPRAGFRLVARASQARPHFHDARAFAKTPRFEHALLLERV